MLSRVSCADTTQAFIVNQQILLKPQNSVRQPARGSSVAETLKVPFGNCLAWRAITDAVALAHTGMPRGQPHSWVKGVGDKSAATFISRFGSVAGLLEAVDDRDADMSPPIRRRLADGRRLPQGRPGCGPGTSGRTLPAYNDALPREPHNLEALVTLGERWNLDNSLNRVLTALTRQPSLGRITGTSGCSACQDRDAHRRGPALRMTGAWWTPEGEKQ